MSCAEIDPRFAPLLPSVPLIMISALVLVAWPVLLAVVPGPP